MRKIYFSILMYISSMCYAREISSQQYTRITGDISNTSAKRASAHNGIFNDVGSKSSQENVWQPMAQHDSIMLKQGKSNAAKQHSVVMRPNNQRNVFHNQLPYELLTRPNTKKLAHIELKVSQPEWHPSKQKDQSHRLPISYYTYNQSSDRNYVLPASADVKLIEPYIVTINKVHTHEGLNFNAADTRGVSHGVSNVGIGADSDADASTPTPFTSAMTLPKDNVGSLISSQKTWKDTMKSGSRLNNETTKKDATVTSVLDRTKSFLNDIGDSNTDDDDINDDDDNITFHKMFASLQKTLDKVPYLNDMARHFIRNNNNENDVDEMENTGNDNNEPTISTTNGNGQGHNNVSTKSALLSLPTRATTARSWPITKQKTLALASIGTGRKIKKLKKKLTKLILPLLFAYKLKFLTLIPVLIGGLTLLVGTTGLAGFFFALFTAVISLKSAGGSKSIVIKKNIGN